MEAGKKTPVNAQQQKVLNDTAMKIGFNQELELEGKHLEVERLLREALKTRQEILGPDSKLVVETMGSLADTLRVLGKYAEALRVQEKVLSTKERVLGRGHSSVALTLSDLAMLKLEMGDIEQASRLQSRALGIIERKKKPEAEFEILNNSAKVHIATGAYSKALPNMERALKIAIELYGPFLEGDKKRRFDYRTSLFAYNFAIVLKNVGQRERARSMCQFAVDNSSYTLMQADFLPLLAGFFEDENKPEKAHALLKESVDVRTKTLGANHPHAQSALAEFATALAEAKQIQSSLEFFDRSRKASASHVSKLLPFLPYREQNLYLQGNFATNLQRSLAFATRHETEAKQLSAAWLANGKGIGQDALSRHSRFVRELRGSKAASVAEELLSVRSRLAHSALKIPTTDTSQYFEAIRRLNDEERRCSNELVELAGTAKHGNRWVTLDEVRQHIPTNGVLIDIAKFGDYDFTLRRPELERYAAWILFPNGKRVEIVDLGLASEVDRLVRDFRRELTTRVGS